MILWKCTVANAMLPLVIFRFQRVKQLIFLILIAANPHVRRSCRLHATQPVPFNLAKEYIRTMELVYRLYKGKQEYYSIVVESALSCNKLITFKKEKNRNPTCGSTFMSISPSPFRAVIAAVLWEVTWTLEAPWRLEVLLELILCAKLREVPPLLLGLCCYCFDNLLRSGSAGRECGRTDPPQPNNTNEVHN